MTVNVIGMDFDLRVLIVTLIGMDFDLGVFVMGTVGEWKVGNDYSLNAFVCDDQAVFSSDLGLICPRDPTS